MTPPITPSPTVLDRLRTFLSGILIDVFRRVSSGGIPMAVNVFIGNRITGHRLRIERIVERIRAGTYVPRRAPAPATRASPPRPRRPRAPSPVKQSFGWLLPLIPPYWNANGLPLYLESLLADPEMVAMIQAAPVSLGRPLRSLCWMLRLKPPPILAAPRRPSPRPTSPAPDPKPPAPIAAAPPTPPTSAPPRPHPPRSRRRPAAPPPASACGPPLPA